MAIKNIRMRPEGSNNYGDILHPETDAEIVLIDSPDFTSTNVKAAMEELFTHVSNGKQAVATAITDKGVTASSSDTFSALATKISQITTQSILTGNATVSQVLTGKTFYSNNPSLRQTGTMPNRGAVTKTLTTQGGQYTIPAGYHSGSGKVTASFANLIAGNIKSGVNVGGVVGQVREGHYASGEEPSQSPNSMLEIRGLDFAPNIVFVDFSYQTETAISFMTSLSSGNMNMRCDFWANPDTYYRLQPEDYSWYTDGFAIRLGKGSSGSYVRPKWYAIRI